MLEEVVLVHATHVSEFLDSKTSGCVAFASRWRYGICILCTIESFALSECNIEIHEH